MRSILPKQFHTPLTAGLGCFYAFSTGTFFALPSLSPLVGLIGILIALVYCSMVCLFGKRALWTSIAAAVAITLAYTVITDSDFSIINYAVASAISINFAIFGSLIISLRKTMSRWQTWSITASMLGGFLELGWLAGLNFS